MSQNHLDTWTPDIPTDILYVIFEMLRDSYCDDPLYEGVVAKTKFDYLLNWIPQVSHVCRSWREAALSDSLLWARICVRPSCPWAVEAVRRSKNVPISIFVDRDKSFSTKLEDEKIHTCTMMIVNENLEHIRKILFKQMDNVCEPDFIISTLGLSGETPVFYPNLEDLEIGFKYIPSKYPALILTNKLRAPKLKRLSLTSCSVDVEFGSFQNLSHLSISYCSSPIMSASRLNGVLAQTPNLKTLILLPYHFKTPDSELQQPVVLPKLLDIHIDGDNTKWISSILQMISYGPSRNVQIRSHSGATVMEHIFPLFECVALHAGDTPKIFEIYFTILPFRRMVNLDAYSQNMTRRLSFHVSPSPCCPQHFGTDFGSVSSLLNGMLHRMSYQDLQVLKLETSEPLTIRLWINLFGRLPSLVSIQIAWDGERDLIGSLVDGTDTPAHDYHTDTTGTTRSRYPSRS